LQSAQQLAEETGAPVIAALRANVYVDLTSANASPENEFVGRSCASGRGGYHRLERDSRCMIITLDPNTGEQTPAILKKVAQAHDGMAGVYGAVLVEGKVQKGDPVEVIS